MTKMESLVVTGELIHLTPEERIKFYVQTCQHMGLDYTTRPLQYFEQIDRNGKRNLILYALRGASAQLRAKHCLNVGLSTPEFHDDVVIFTAQVTDQKGQMDCAVGAESLKGLEGKEYADRIMAAQTKAKRRVILDFVGSALLDESEVEGMKGSIVEVTESELKGYIPPPPAPQPVTASAPATEVFDPVPAATKAEEKKATEALFSPEPPFEVPTIPQVTSVVATEQEITLRMNTYRRDVLQRGGMKPSKGFGIAAKWTKFLSKHAPNKTVEEYTTLLTALDLCLEQLGPAGVVAKIEQEIA